MAAPILVVGYGNSLRGDDGIGPCVADRLAARGLPGVGALAVPQLLPELAAELAEVRLVIFVDARVGPPQPEVEVIPLDPAGPADLMTHVGTPQALLALARTVYGTAPEAWCVSVAGQDFDFEEHLSPAGERNAGLAVEKIEAMVRVREKSSP
jgi:hydrogenase maturation protease